MSDDGYPDAHQGLTLIKTPAGSGYKGVSSRPAGTVSYTHLTLPTILLV